jgi:hypothetical protein
MKKRIRKKKDTQIIERFGAPLLGLLEPVLNLAEEFNPKEIRTQEEKLRTATESELDKLDVQEFAENFLQLLIKFDFKTAAAQIRTDTRKDLADKKQADARFKDFYQLLADTEKICPNIVVMLLLTSDPRETIIKAVEPFDLIDEFPKLKGEVAARSAIRIFREVAELLYTGYLKMIAALVQIQEGKESIKVKSQFGTLAAHLPGKLASMGYLDLIEEDCGWLRNGCCHGHWRYDVKLDRLTIWDNKKPERDFSPTELFEKAMRMYSTVTAIQLLAVLLYLKEKVACEWFDLFSYFQKNLMAIIREEKPISEKALGKIENLFGHLRKIEYNTK